MKFDKNYDYHSIFNNILASYFYHRFKFFE